MTSNNTVYIPFDHDHKITYSREKLYKYHEISKSLNNIESSDNSFKSAISIELLEKLKNRPDIEEVEVNNIFYYKEDVNSGNNVLLDVLEDHLLAPHELQHYHNLLFIVSQYVKYDYRMFFIKNEQTDSIDKPDANVHSDDMELTRHAYDVLKSLRNLLKMRESNLEDVKIVFDLCKENKKQKEYQVAVWDKFDKKDLINKAISNTLELLYTSQLPYLSGHRFAGQTIETLTSDFVSEIFEEVRPQIEYDGKKSSNKREFKGLILHVVKRYARGENDFTTNGGQQVDDRLEKLITYDLLMKYGLIELSRVSGHRTKDDRIKYIESLPDWSKSNYKTEFAKPHKSFL